MVGQQHKGERQEEGAEDADDGVEEGGSGQVLGGGGVGKQEEQGGGQHRVHRQVRDDLQEEGEGCGECGECGECASAAAKLLLVARACSSAELLAAEPCCTHPSGVVHSLT